MIGREPGPGQLNDALFTRPHIWSAR
jgi:hypothetical protein